MPRRPTGQTMGAGAEEEESRSRSRRRSGRKCDQGRNHRRSTTATTIVVVVIVDCGHATGTDPLLPLRREDGPQSVRGPTRMRNSTVPCFAGQLWGGWPIEQVLIPTRNPVLWAVPQNARLGAQKSKNHCDICRPHHKPHKKCHIEPRPEAHSPHI